MSLKYNIVKIVEYINFYKYDNDNLTDIMISNEVNSSNYMDSSFKLNELYKHTYIDYHIRIGDNYYDVFAYTREETDKDNLLQIILCNNYVEIYKFSQDNYDNRVKVSRFNSLTSKIYSFYDSSIIVIESDTPADVEYETP